MDGLKALSAAKLASAGGVSKSSVFHHFKSIEDVLSQSLQLVVDEMRMSMGSGEFRDAEHFLQSLGEGMFRTPDASATLFRAFLCFSHESLFNPAYRESLASFIEQTERFFRSELSKLAPDSADPALIDAAASLLLPILDGIGFHYLLNPDAEKYRRVWTIQTSGIVRMLKPPS